MAALNLLSRRWVLRIIWELRDEPLGFRQLQARCDGMSPDTLSTRLNELREAGIAGQDAAGAWCLTRLGQELGPALNALSSWSQEWAGAVERGEIG
jgi:DNA-binding HxlR family transcriptional regulator